LQVPQEIAIRTCVLFSELHRAPALSQHACIRTLASRNFRDRIPQQEFIVAAEIADPVPADDGARPLSTGNIAIVEAIRPNSAIAA